MEPTIRLIHLTDPHLTSLHGQPLWSLRGKRWSGYLSWRRKRRFVHRGDVLERITEAVRAENPVQLLVTGDLAHVGLPEEIEAAGRWLEALGPPEQVMLVPGNHDVYAGDSWPAVASAWGPYLAPVRPGAASDGQPATASDGLPATSSDGLPATWFPLQRWLDCGERRICLVGLSSAIPSPLFMAYGKVGAAQRAQLDEMLAEADAFRCVLMHHPPLPAMTSRRKGLLDAAQVCQVLSRRGAELVLHGHVHRNVSAPGPGGARVFGTASASSGTGDVASYRSFDVTAGAAGWHVDMRLMTLADGGCRVAAQESWEVPVRPANAASAAR